MRRTKCHLAYALGALAIGATLALDASVGAENATTIDQSTQPHLKSWSNIIPNANRRFVVLGDFNSEAVLDRETGLVWEKSPDRLLNYPWIDALALCANKAVGGRKGWRLPSFVELSSLVDPNAVSFPTLPAGHPFGLIEAAFYWSATSLTGPGGATNAWGVFFNNGIVGLNGKPGANFAWCVRGGMNAEVY
jgi:hypothetical protein